MNERFLIGIALAGVPIVFLALQIKRVLAEEESEEPFPFHEKDAPPTGRIPPAEDRPDLRQNVRLSHVAGRVDRAAGDVRYAKYHRPRYQPG